MYSILLPPLGKMISDSKFLAVFISINTVVQSMGGGRDVATPGAEFLRAAESHKKNIVTPKERAQYFALPRY